MTKQWVWLMAIGLVLALVSTAMAGEREPTAEQLKQYDAELAKMRKEKPDEYRAMIAGLQMMLGTFGFGTGPFDGVLDTKTREAIRKYQRVRKIPETGDLDGTTFLMLNRDFKVWRRDVTDVGLTRLYVNVDLWDKGYVKVEGTWTIVGKESYWPFPVQTTEIHCYKDRGYCFDATAILTETNLLDVDQEVYTIAHWDEYVITTKTQNTWFCFPSFTMRIGRLHKSVTAFCTRMQEELKLNLTDGFEITQKLEAKRKAKIREVLQIPGFLDKR